MEKENHLEGNTRSIVIHLDESHTHLAMLEQSEFFHLLFNDEIYSLIIIETEVVYHVGLKPLNIQRCKRGLVVHE